MCRNIKPLYNFEPPASEAEVAAAALQFVRKVSGFAKPSQSNQPAFEQAVNPSNNPPKPPPGTGTTQSQGAISEAVFTLALTLWQTEGLPQSLKVV